jgi:hypothetical protein
MRARTRFLPLGGALALLLVCTLTLASPEPVQLPATGQTAIHAPGDDGDLRLGVASPSPRFVDHGDGTVTDKLTGLMWTKSAVDSSGNWWNVLNTIADWNQAKKFGHDDWRLPNANELYSLVDLGESTPALPAGHPFVNVATLKTPFYGYSEYWCSTSCDVWWITADYYAFTVRFEEGLLAASHKNRGQLAWMCRTAGAGKIRLPRTGQAKSYYPGDDGESRLGAEWPDPRYVDHGDGTVTDSLTGLMWLKDADPLRGSTTWLGAFEFVASLNEGEGTRGYKDWRLPNAREFQSLCDASAPFDQLSPGNPFLNVKYPGKARYYWLSTTPARFPGRGGVGELFGGIGHIPKEEPSSEGCTVWPVRGGISANEAPVADAGRCQIRAISVNSLDAAVILDGSLSTDADGDALACAWYEGETLLAEGSPVEVALTVGSHDVRLVASDGCDTAEDTVTIQVVTAGNAAMKLAESIAASGLPKGTARSLVASLENAAARFEAGKPTPGANKLGAFQNKVLAQSGKKLDGDLAALWIEQAQLIIGAASDAALESTGKSEGGKLRVRKRLSFGKVVVGDTKARTLEIRNRGNSPLTISISVPEGSPFYASGGAQAVEIPAGATLELSVAFAPREAGTAKHKLTIGSDDPRRPEVTVTVMGKGR